MGIEIVIGLLVLLLIAVVLGGWILGVIGFVRSLGLRKELSRLLLALRALESRLRKLEGPPPPVMPQPPAEQEAPARRAEQPRPEEQPQEVPVPLPSAPPPRPPALTPVAGPPPPGPPPSAEGLGGLESRIGKRWIAWVGVVVLFFSAAFFLKHAFENRWIGPTGQVIIGALAGVAMLIAGSRFISRRWRILGQCLVGVGLAVLYASFFAAFSLYERPVMPQWAAFAFMVAVTIAGVALAVLHNALAIAFMAVLGGVLTPVLLSTGEDARDALFTYLLLLNLGVLAVAFFRGWRLLDALAIAGTFCLYAGWYARFYKPPALAPALAWLGGFYLVFLALPFVYHLVRRIRLTIERFIMALANAAFTFVLAWLMLHEDYRMALGFVALGMAAAYLVVGTAVRRRLPGDARALFGSVALAVTFLTLAVPLHLRAHGIMLAWAIEGPVLLYLGYRFRYRPVRVFAAAALVLSVFRLFAAEAHWPLHVGLYVPLVNRQFISAMMVPMAAAAYALVHHRFKQDGGVVDRVLKLCSSLSAGMLTLIILHAEIGGWLENDYSSYAAGCAVTALWAAGALVYLLAGAKARAAAGWTWGTGAAALAVALVLGAALFAEDMGSGHLLFLNLRFASGLLVAAGAFAYAWGILRTPLAWAEQRRALAAVMGAVGMVALLSLLSVEAYTFCWDAIRDATRAGRAAQMAVTLVWGAYAGSLIFVGFWRRWRSLRLAGLGLFGVSALKLVLVDLTHVKDVYRIVSFLALGLLMVGASYLYHRLEKRLAGPKAQVASASEAPPEGEPR